jgi:cold shock CspA family protein
MMVTLAIDTAMRELVVGKVISWDRRGFAFAQTADGRRFFVGGRELRLAGIQRLEIGELVRFETRLATAGRAPWGTNIRVVSRGAPA